MKLLLPFLHLDHEIRERASLGNQQLMRRIRRNMHYIAFAQVHARPMQHRRATKFTGSRALLVLQLAARKQRSLAIHHHKDVREVGMHLRPAILAAIAKHRVIHAVLLQRLAGRAMIAHGFIVQRRSLFHQRLRRIVIHLLRRQHLASCAENQRNKNYGPRRQQTLQLS